MTKGLEVFNVAPEGILYNIDKAKQKLQQPLNQAWIKQRSQGGTTLSYIGGHTVIELLNSAFNYQWSFEVIKEDIVPSLPKPAFSGWGKQRKPVLNPDGSQKMEEQPPVAKVLGRLTVPGLGIKEQYGSKVLIGGATEQESAFKSATTDAMKKCASLFGIGLELYKNEEELMNPVQHEEYQQVAPAQMQVAPAQVDVAQFQTAAQHFNQAPAQELQYSAPAQRAVGDDMPITPAQQAPIQTAPPIQPVPTQQTAPPIQQSATSGAAPLTWEPGDVQRLKDLKVIMGITSNDGLLPYLKKFFDNENVTIQTLSPSNVKAFNVFLTKQAELL